MKKLFFDQFNKKLAFTLVEVLISIALAASIMTIAYTFYFFSLNLTTEGMNKIDIQKKVRIAIEHITSDIRSAKEIIRIEPGLLELKKFIDTKEGQNNIDFYGNTMKIKYEYVKKGQGQAEDAIMVEVDGIKVTLMNFDSINNNIFEAYTFDPNETLVLFDYCENDSIMRSKISLVKLKFEVKQGKTVVNINTSVNPRFLYGFKQQPYWNFTK